MKYLSGTVLGRALRLHTPYDDGKFIQPWIGLGINYMQQSNFADLADAEGNAYFYWSDGKVYDMAEDHTCNVLARELTPDYTYESQTATQRNVAVPIRLGVNLNLTPRVYASAAFAMLAGAEASLDPRPGYRDMLTTAQAGIGIRVGRDYAEPRIELPVELAELGNDFDQDGVKDNRDRCPATPRLVRLWTSVAAQQTPTKTVLQIMKTSNHSHPIPVSTCRALRCLKRNGKPLRLNAASKRLRRWKYSSASRPLRKPLPFGRLAAKD